MAKAIRKPGTAGVSRRAGGGKVAKKMPTPIAKTKGQASIPTEMKARASVARSLGRQATASCLARKPPPRTKPSKERFQQLKHDRERTASILNYVAHHREALLGSLEPSELRDRAARRNGIRRLGRRWFHGESEAVRQAYFAGKSVSSDVGACPLERRPDEIAESGGGGGGSAAVAPCARQPSPKICAPARRHARSCQVRAPPMKFLLGMQVASRDANSHIPNERGP